MRVRFNRVRSTIQPGWVGLVVWLLVFTVPAGGNPGSALSVPGSMVLLDDGDLLAVACERSGEVKVLDAETGEILFERNLGKRIASLASMNEGEWLIAAVSQPDEVVLLAADQSAGALSTIRLPDSPGHLAVSGDGNRIAVAIPRQRSVLFYNRKNSKLVEESGTELQFTPGRLLFLPDRRLAVADASGGKLATINSDGRISEVETQFHNISGMTISPDGKRVLVSHQRGSSLARSSFDDVHWGSLMRNEITSFPVEDFPGDDTSIQTLAVGGVDDAAGDPAGLVVGSDWRIFVALAGVNQLGVFSPGDSDPFRLDTGRRPRTLLLDEKRNRLFVGNSLSDSVSVFDAEKLEVIAEHRISGDQPLTARDRGERLFFDAQLSHDGWMSCHSCHTGGHTNDRLADTLGDGAHGNPKRVPSLLGVRDTAPFGWNGSFPDLESQIAKTVDSTMHHGELLTGEQMADLVAFLESLDPPEPVAAGKPGSVDRGRALFKAELRCDECHDPATCYTSADTYDVGIADELGNERFNPPSLRGVAGRGSFFHDGRAETLEDVFTEQGHQLEERELTKGELKDLLAFLRSL